LESLKTKSLLERLGDGTKTRIGMHDLWRSFCVAETQNEELGCQRWAYVTLTRPCTRLVYTTPSGIWQNVQRMAFMGFTSVLIISLPSVEAVLKGANFAHFPNVSVLKTTDLCMTRSAVLDLSRLVHLRSLEVSGKALRMLELGGLPRGLIFLSLRWDELEGLDSDFSQHLLKQIECLEELEYLQMIRYGGDKLPNLSSMVSMRKAVFHYCGNVVTLSGLGPHLQVLDLRGCWKLQSCPSVGDLVVLEELNCRECSKLENLPDLRKLRKLHKLDISECGNINEVPGLGDLEALMELYAGVYKKQSIAFKIPDLRKLKNLEVLHFGNRYLEAVPGFDNLISLRKVVADFQNVVDKPCLLQLTKLEELKMDGWSLAGLSALQTLTMLRSLEIDNCSAVDDLPDLESLVNLQTLKIVDCKFKDVSGLSNLSTLERLQLERCTQLEIIPALQRLTRLKWVEIRACPLLRGWGDTLGQDEGRDDTTFVLERRDSMRLLGLQTLTLSQCASLTSIAAFSMLETLDCWEIGMRELPDLSNFPRLSLTLWSCESLEILTCHEPMHALSVLFLHDCNRLATLPDLCNFPGLLQLRLEDRKMTTLSCSVPLTRLQQLVIRGRVTRLPDMGVYFPAVTKVELAVLEVETLSSTVPLPALRVLELTKCLDLKALPDLQMFPALESLDVSGCQQLSRLSSSEPLPALQKLDARECISLNPDDIVRLRALCPNCFIKDIHDP
jgi:Leucine-rich repeat (LRR) protein